jgi:hypothetical protein
MLRKHHGTPRRKPYAQSHEAERMLYVGVAQTVTMKYLECHETWVSDDLNTAQAAASAVAQCKAKLSIPQTHTTGFYVLDMMRGTVTTVNDAFTSLWEKQDQLAAALNTY